MSTEKTLVTLDASHGAGRAGHALPPCALVILGGAGDLSRRKLLPALYNLMLDSGLPEQFAVQAFSLEELNDESYRELAREGVQQFSRRPPDEENWAKFARMLHYFRGNLGRGQDYAAMAQRLSQLEAQFGTGGNRLFYFGIPPQFIEAAASGLGQAALVRPARPDGPFTRVVVEKPIGHDLASARAINDQLARYFDESQLFRIDHYLGKERVENLLVLRFANSFFEPLWSTRFIDHVQITVAEEEGVGTRAPYYEKAGALCDMVQSHLLQVLCLIAMEPPRSTEADAVRDAKLDVVRTLRPLSPEEVSRWVVRGQYGEGLVRGEKAKAYREEAGVDPESTTETFVALKCFVENWRWAGVPFYLRTGKRMAKRASEIGIYFNAVPRILFNSSPRPPLEPNVLLIRIQPEEGLSLRIISKVPGQQLRLNPVMVDFQYASASPEAYETLLRDVIAGDQTLFMRRDTVEASWRFVEQIVETWRDNPTDPASYAAGSWGPIEAALMIAADGRAWRTL